jgi:hypothetical protein
MHVLARRPIEKHYALVSFPITFICLWEWIIFLLKLPILYDKQNERAHCERKNIV